MTENKRYSFNWESGHPNFWDNHCDLADCYLTCGDVVNILNELNDENEQLKLLLREVEHELTTLTGLTATDSTSIVKEDMEEYGLFRLDYTELLKKIYKELQE